MVKLIVVFFIGVLIGGVISNKLTVDAINKRDYRIGGLNNKKIKKILR